jgi:hypothetical protein
MSGLAEDERAFLRSRLFDSSAHLTTLECLTINRLLDFDAERNRLAAELARWESGQRRLDMPVVQSVPDGLRYAAELVRAAHEVDDYRLAELMRGAGMRLRALHDAASRLLAEAVVTREENRQLREAGEDLDGALALAIAHHAPECRCCDHQALARWRES